MMVSQEILTKVWSRNLYKKALITEATPCLLGKHEQTLYVSVCSRLGIIEPNCS